MKGGDLLSRLIAYETIARHGDLLPGEKVVAALILSHYNAKQRRCDPGADTLVAESGMSRATVFRSIARLDQLGLIIRKSYRGRSRRNAYLPNWKALNRSPSATVKASLEPFSQCDSQPFSQCDTNQRRETNTRYALRAKGSPPHQGRQGQARQSERDGQLYLTHVLPGGKGPSHRDAAEAAAHRKRAEAIAKLPRHERERAWLREIVGAADQGAARVLPEAEENAAGHSDDDRQQSDFLKRRNTAQKSVKTGGSGA